MALLMKRQVFPGQSTRVVSRWRVASSGQVKGMLGLAPSAKLPGDGMAARLIDNVVIFVRALPPRPVTMRHRRSNHRVRALCPVCGRDLSLGRLPQHLLVHPDWPS